jgi:hypothetical protein
MDRRIPPHAHEVGEVDLFRGHAALMPDRVEVALLQIREGQWLDGRRGEQTLLRFFPSIHQAVLCLFLIRALAGFKALRADGIALGHPPHRAPLIESLR